MARRENATDQYMNQWVNYGGVWTRVGAVYADLAEKGDVRGMWMAGYQGAGNPVLTDAELAELCA